MVIGKVEKMIRSKNGKTKVKGNYEVLMADLATIVKALSNVMDKEDIMYAANLGLKTDEEIKEESKALLKELGEVIQGLTR